MRRRIRHMVTPELTVAAVVERNGRFLIVEERVRGRLVLNQPAGHVEPGESLIEAVIRETREETAWVLKPAAITGIYHWRCGAKPADILRTVFCGECSEQISETHRDDDIVAIHWLTYGELTADRDRLRSPLVLRSIEDYLAGRRYPLEVVQQLTTAEP